MLKLNMRSKAFVLLLIANLELAFYPIALKFTNGINTFSFLFYSFLIATILSFIVLSIKNRFSRLVELFKNPKAAATVATSGLLNYALASTLLAIGIIHTSASLGAIIYRSWILLMILFIPFILKTKVNKYQIVSLLLGFVAVYIALTQGTLTKINLVSAPFIGYMLLAALSIAISNLIIKGQNNDLYVQIFLFNVTTLAFFFLATLFTHAPFLLQLSPKILLLSLFVGAVTYTLGEYFYFYALKVLEPTLIGNTSMLIPFVSFVLAAIFLKETIYPYYIFLALLVIAGIIIQQSSPNKVPERVRNKHVSDRLTIFDITSTFTDNKTEEIFNYIKGSNRALATSGELAEMYDNMPIKEKTHFAQKYKCLLFTNKNPHGSVMPKELDFINEVMGTEKKGVLIGMGNPKNIEDAFDEFNSRNKYI